jgi:hypothetical protein
VYRFCHDTSKLHTMTPEEIPNEPHAQSETSPSNSVEWMVWPDGKPNVTRWLKRCVRLARSTWKVNRKYARHAASLGARSSPVQFLEAYYAVVKYDLVADDYYRYALYDPEKRRDAAFFIPSRVHKRFRRRLFSTLDIAEAIVDDKRLFSERCRQHGIAVVPTLGEFEDGRMVKGGQVALPREDLFSKEACGIAGRGAMPWAYTGRGTWQSGDGPPMSEDEVRDALSQLSRNAPIILQPRLRNHPAIAPLSLGALCTARIMTCRGYDSTPEVMGSLFRAPVENRSVDNYSQGGLASGIDPAGVLGPAVSKKLPDGMRRVDRHPVTGARIAGLQLPFWHEAKQMAMAAHTLYPQFPSIGWDVAITAEGPVMIEANAGWGIRLAQHATGQPYGRTRLMASYLTWVEQAKARQQPAIRG